MELIFSLILLYFAIGAIAIIMINLKSDAKSARERWVKYFFYLVIVNLIVFSIIYKFFFWVGFAITIICIYELKNTRSKPSLKSVGFAVVLGLLLFCFYLFTAFTLHKDQLFVYMLVFIFDGFSQIAGQLFGKYKFVPKISPEKTLEGTLGGLTIAVLTGFLLKDFMEFSAIKALLLSLFICLYAFAGDLLASAFKRHHGIKDFSRLIPGHGGLMDRFDSFIAAGAFFFLLTLLSK